MAGRTQDDAAPEAGPGVGRLLRFEAEWWGGSAGKPEAIRREFGWSQVRYYQALDRVLATRAALEADPLLVGRILRARERAARVRAARRDASGER